MMVLVQLFLLAVSAITTRSLSSKAKRVLCMRFVSSTAVVAAVATVTPRDPDLLNRLRRYDHSGCVVGDKYKRAASDESRRFSDRSKSRTLTTQRHVAKVTQLL